MKKLILMTMVALTIFAAACSDDNGNGTPDPTGDITILKADIDFKTVAASGTTVNTATFGAIEVENGVVKATTDGISATQTLKITAVTGDVVTSTVLEGLIETQIEAQLAALKGIAGTCTVVVNAPVDHTTAKTAVVTLEAEKGYKFATGQDKITIYIQTVTDDTVTKVITKADIDVTFAAITGGTTPALLTAGAFTITDGVIVGAGSVVGTPITATAAADSTKAGVSAQMDPLFVTAIGDKGFLIKVTVLTEIDATATADAGKFTLTITADTAGGYVLDGGVTTSIDLHVNLTAGKIDVA